MKNPILFYIFCLCCLTGFSQASLNDSASFGGKVSIGGSLNDGNFQRLGLTNNADFTFNTTGRKFGFENHTQYNFTRTFGVLQENDLLTRTLFYSKLQKRWYATFIIWYETNELRQMHPLVQAGPSIEYAWLLQNENMSGISLGATGEHKHFDSNMFSAPKYDGSYHINTSRLFARLHGKNKIGISKIALTYDLYYMPSFQYSDNYRVHAETTLEVPLSEHLHLHIGANYNYESVVIAGVKPNDFFTEYGLSISF